MLVKGVPDRQGYAQTHRQIWTLSYNLLASNNPRFAHASEVNISISTSGQRHKLLDLP